MAPAAIEDIKLVTKHLPGDMSETPSPDGPLFAVPSSRSSSISTATWLKLNSNAPAQFKVEKIPTISHEEPFTGAKKLRHLLENTDELVVCPGVYDGLSARTAIELGFKSMYMPDLAIAQLADMRDNADMIANLDPFGPPLIADMDTGYGGPIMVARTVEHYIRSGVAGAHLEDQILTKRCGHLSGKKVVPREEYMTRIRAAVAAKRRLKSDFVLIARTDALQSLGYDECIERLKEARTAGADVGLLEGFKSKEQAAAAVAELAPWPLLLNSVENGHSPLITVEEAREMGFRIMIFSFATLAPAYAAIRETLLRLKNHGVVGTPDGITPVKLFEVCGLGDAMQVDIGAGGGAFAEGV
ncbi:hypothetical protein J7T55_007989 [Diaporthe amygdali]|uniref:uncharacterized protein n=1 Tax=Phomopsis amygdali TaxID=1214568 RepID=UPI0022FE6723|nr:uncharacterized protein J7T55_007989 [Diaporthe amygdali]KAJ0114155.1 hypothetical protein J7T55_007989 [Diaporthe amygdali]